MATDSIEAKQHAHQLIDQLGPAQIDAVVQFLEKMAVIDEDGDTLSNAKRRAIAEADEWLKHNEPIPHERALGQLGLSMADWEKMVDEP